MGSQDEAANHTSLARIRETANKKDEHFCNFEENLCTLLYALLVALNTSVAAVFLVIGRWARYFNVVGVVPVALNRVKDILQSFMELICHGNFIERKTMATTPRRMAIRNKA